MTGTEMIVTITHRSPRRLVVTERVWIEDSSEVQYRCKGWNWSPEIPAVIGMKGLYVDGVIRWPMPKGGSIEIEIT